MSKMSVNTVVPNRKRGLSKSTDSYKNVFGSVDILKDTKTEENNDREDEVGSDDSESEISDASESVEDYEDSSSSYCTAGSDLSGSEPEYSEVAELDRATNSKDVTRKKRRVKKSDTLEGPTSQTDISNENGTVVEKTKEESELDTSDEEDIRNTVGNIPMNWYDEFPHIGYDWNGKKIIKPNHGDQLDYFLKKMEDPNFWRTIRDPQTGQDVILSDKDIELIKKLQSGVIPDPNFNAYEPWVEWFSSEVLHMPLRKFPEHKRSFVPSRDEMKKVSKYVHALKMGWMKKRSAIRRMKKENEKKGPQFYMLWNTDDGVDEMRRIEHHIPAPKRPLPDHAESYNPPEEYLFDEKELKKWERERKSLGNKKLHFVPKKYNSLREVPSYKRYIRERFLRCLDLYMCPRAIKMKLTIEPEDLVPHLPSPKDLQPFPVVMSIIYEGHKDMVRSISIDSSGQYLASASDDTTVKFWEISTGRCLKTIEVGGIARHIAWNPNRAVCLVAVASDKNILLINPGLGDHLVVSKTDSLLEEPPAESSQTPERIKSAVQWDLPSDEQSSRGVRIVLHHFKEVKQIVWHGIGDYFSSLMPEGDNRSVIIHQISKRKSQLPFSKAKGLVQAILFHPTKPYFFVATQRNVRVYDLIKQEQIKKLYSNSQWISSLAIHPGGDNLLVGTYDRKVLWFDLDLSTKPYKSLVLHNAAVRSVAFHKRYPLFASASDDMSLIICHGMVYNDLLKNALIVPLKRLSSHEKVDDFSLFDVKFHPFQPWVFTSGADGTIRLYT